MPSPRTPHESGCAAKPSTEGDLRRSRGVSGDFFYKVRRGSAGNPWIIICFYTKRLSVEQIFCRVGFVFPRVRPYLPPVSLFSPHSPFLIFNPIYLSILLIIKRKKAIEDKKKGEHLIHGFVVVSKISSTGYKAIHGLIRGNPWKLSREITEGYVDIGPYPRVHGLFCAPFLPAIQVPFI